MFDLVRAQLLFLVLLFWRGGQITFNDQYGGVLSSASSYVKEIRPQSVDLYPGQSQQFCVWVVMDENNVFQEQDSSIYWEAVNNGGVMTDIGACGVFTAGSTVGSFLHTIRAVSHADTVFASVNVLGDTSTVLSTPTPIADYVLDTEFNSVILNTSPSSIPTSISTPTPTPVQAPAPTPIPTRAFISTPTSTPAFMLGLSPTPTPDISSVVPMSPTPVVTGNFEIGKVLKMPIFSGGGKVVYTPPEPAPEQIFDYLDEKVDSCLRENFSMDEYKRYFAVDDGRGDVRDLGERLNLARDCWMLKRVVEVDESQEMCLRKRLGEERYLAVWFGGEEPTQLEVNKANVCLPKLNLINYEDKVNDQISIKCLEIKLGVDRLRELKSDLSLLSVDELHVGRSCLGLDAGVVKPPVVLETGNAQNECIRQVLGDERFREVYGQGKQPTNKEAGQTDGCFEFVGGDKPVQMFLPVLPVQVPFVTVDKQTVSIASAGKQAREMKDTLVLNGKGPTNSILDIYIFSEPMVVSVKTDVNGDWTYELAYHLPEGNHHTYAVVRHPEKGLVRSEVFNFGVAYARDSRGEPTQELLVTRQRSGDLFQLYLTAAVSVVLLGMGGVLLMYRMRLEETLITDSRHFIVGDRQPEIKEKQWGE